jgi:pimeloyl-ACP methyl ester carboxylesterase
VGGWEAVYNHLSIWHFRFNGPTPEALVRGRERTSFEYFWNDFAADKTHSIPEADRKAYTAAYGRPRRMHAGWPISFRSQRAAKDFAQFSQNKLLLMPVLTMGDDKLETVRQQTKLVATDVTVVVFKDTGHWVLEERPKDTTEALQKFF